MADKKESSKQVSDLDRYENERHNENARAAAAPQTNTPRINTDNL
ncbi:hypothetical protein [Neobacillus niacini]